MGLGRLGRRRFLQRAGIAGGALLLAACRTRNGAGPTTAEPQEPAQTSKAEPQVTAAPAQANRLQILWRTNPDENAMVNALIGAFEARNPNIHLELIPVPWAEFESQLLSLFAAGAAPDIYGTGGASPWIERAYRGMVLALDPYLEREGEAFAGDIWPVALSSYRKNGRLVAMTFAVTGAGVFINATQFDQAGVPYPPVDWRTPWTWDEMIETARRLTRATNGKVDAFGINLAHYTPWYYTRLWGGDLVSQEDYDSGLLHRWQTDTRANYEACIAGLQARADAILKHQVMPSPATTAALVQIGPLFRSGAVAMEFGPGSTLWGPLPEEYRFRAATNPVGGAGGAGTTCRNCWTEPVQINARTRSPGEAWSFVRFMAADPAALRIELQHRAALPACRSGLELYLQEHGKQLAMTLEEQRTFFAGAIEQAETTVPDHILVGAAAIRDLQTAELDPVWRGEKTVKEAIDALIPKVNARLAANLEALNLATE